MTLGQSCYPLWGADIAANTTLNFVLPTVYEQLEGREVRIGSCCARAVRLLAFNLYSSDTISYHPPITQLPLLESSLFVDNFPLRYPYSPIYYALVSRRLEGVAYTPHSIFIGTVRLGVASRTTLYDSRLLPYGKRCWVVVLRTVLALQYIRAFPGLMFPFPCEYRSRGPTQTVPVEIFITFGSRGNPDFPFPILTTTNNHHMSIAVDCLFSFVSRLG